jgi:hypothetical protein
MKNKGS